jgi:Ran GTPase-activating protein (RanGAP) involved in mRNA processing and transport
MNDPFVTALDLSSSGLNPEALVTLCVLVENGNINLKHVNLSNNPAVQLMMPDVVRLANTVGHVELNNCKLTDTHIEELTTAMSDPTKGDQIKSLSLNDNPDLTSNTISMFARVLRMRHCTMEHLNMDGCPKISPVQIRWLGFYLDLNSQNKSFKQVLLAVDAKQDIPSLSFCVPRRASPAGNDRSDAGSSGGGFDLFRREFDDKSVRLVCIALSVNRSVTSLSFKGNRVTDKGAKLLATLLKRNTTLVSLDLSYNEITNVGVVELAKALETNNTLEELNLAENQNANNLKLLEAVTAKLLSNTLNKRRGKKQN